MRRRALICIGVATCILGAGVSICSHAQQPPGPPGSPEARMKSLNEVEPRIAITALPFEITNSGSFYMTASVQGESNKNGIVISHSDVKLDLSGFALNGRDGSLNGIVVPTPVDNITIQNGVLRGWDDTNYMFAPGGTTGGDFYGNILNQNSMGDGGFSNSNPWLNFEF